MKDEWFFRDMLRKAAELALGRFHDATTWNKKDRTNITESDLAVQAFLIAAHMP